MLEVETAIHHAYMMLPSTRCTTPQAKAAMGSDPMHVGSTLRAGLACWHLPATLHH